MPFFVSNVSVSLPRDGFFSLLLLHHSRIYLIPFIGRVTDAIHCIVYKNLSFSCHFFPVVVVNKFHPNSFQVCVDFRFFYLLSIHLFYVDKFVFVCCCCAFLLNQRLQINSLRCCICALCVRFIGLASAFTQLHFDVAISSGFSVFSPLQIDKRLCWTFSLSHLTWCDFVTNALLYTLIDSNGMLNSAVWN